MTITVPLTDEEEARLEAIAGGHGVSPDAFINALVKGILERSQPEGEAPRSGGAVGELDDLFAVFDSVNSHGPVREEAFHRENWYR